MSTYLSKRGSVYYFRRPIPFGLRYRFDGRAEFVISLRTKERAEAKRLIPFKVIETERLLAAVSSPDETVLPERVRDSFEGKFQSAGSGKPRANKAVIEQVQVGPRAAAPDQLAVMLDEGVVDGWAAERKPVQKGIDTHRAVARWFYDRLGRIPVSAITRADVLTFKAKLIEEGTSAANIRVKLSRLRTLLQWAADNDLASENVAKGITIKDAMQGRNRRREFDLDSLRRVFNSPVFVDGHRPAAGKGEAAYWLPILALYTGARLEELGQLRAADICEHPYVDDEGLDRSSVFIHIRSDDADGLILKNAASERLVPLHPVLTDRGFLGFVAASREAKEQRLFPKLRPNIYGRLTAKWGEWFGSYLRNTCGILDRRLVFHSFRHTFKHYARHSGIVEGVQRQIMGHTSSDTADMYGSGYTLWQVVQGMELYTVPGLSIPIPA